MSHVVCKLAEAKEWSARLYMSLTMVSLFVDMLWHCEKTPSITTNIAHHQPSILKQLCYSIAAALLDGKTTPFLGYMNFINPPTTLITT